VHRVTARFSALMATPSNRRRLGARPGFIQIAPHPRHFILGRRHAAFIFKTSPSGVQSKVMASPPARLGSFSNSLNCRAWPDLTVDPLCLADHRPDRSLGGKTRASRMNILQTGRRPNSRVYSIVERCTSMVRLRERLMARPKSSADFVQENGFGSALAASIEQVRKRVLRTAHLIMKLIPGRNGGACGGRRCSAYGPACINGAFRGDMPCVGKAHQSQHSRGIPSLFRSRPFGFVNRKMFSFRSNPASFMA
jgi:hypothetical protein